MDRKLKLGTLMMVVGITIVLAVLGLGVIEAVLNHSEAIPPDKSCNSDADCVIKLTTCGACACGDAVNKDWRVFCPFRSSLGNSKCMPCATPNDAGDAGVARCVGNVCTIVRG
jgi:hypothetical protein